MKKIFLSGLLVLAFHAVFAQRNFKPGYILQQQDTLRGLVDERGDRRSAAKVVFKASAEAEAITYTPAEIGGYGLDGGHRFETHGLGTGDTAQVHFFTLLVKGYASLYFFRDKDSRDRFYLLKDGSLRELVAYKAIEKVQGRRVSIPYNLFRGTLQEAFKDCPALAAKAKNLRYREKELIQYVTDYNNGCTPLPPQTYVAQPRQAVSSWGVAAGATHTSLQVSGSSERPRYNQSFTSWGPSAALFYHLTLPWLNKKFALQLELQYQPQKYTNVVTESESAMRYEYDVHLTLNYLKVPVLLRYAVPVGKLKPFFNLGFVNSFAVKVKDETSVTRTLIYQGSSTVSSEPYLKEYRKYAQGYLAGFGLALPAWSKHPVTVEARYERGNGFSDYVGIPTITDQFSVLVGYGF
ncbi:PorT family protein [Rufibacter immobilis]|uniref:PorT family protein n=1 Tax=Rufibacter immobilis TaxID=1348778 RepID=A0A3M9N2P1_9BACT|nr:porin family protein [Rufibacter immobilis]RNI32019.1 PorT family protein [Rufibacter immobilis]